MGDRRSKTSSGGISNELLFDRQSVRAVDRAAIEEYGIPGIVLMENAARSLAAEALKMLDPQRSPATVLIICGSGNNGGDGYALARHLHNAGRNPILVSLGEPAPETDAAVNRQICRKLALRERAPDAPDLFGDADLIVDAIFGTGLARPVRGAAAEMIERINAAEAPVLAVDVPSGLDCDTGQELGTAVKATRTVTFVGPKSGFGESGAGQYTGTVVVADIGAPVELVERFGRRRPPRS